MQTFIMLTRLRVEGAEKPLFVKKKERQVAEEIKKHCPEVEWLHNYAVLGPWDYVDIFRAPDLETAFQVSAVVRAAGGAHTEVWPALEWDCFKKVLKKNPSLF